jgi:DNA polymerase
MSSWTAIVDDLIGHVTLLKELGERNVEIDPAVMTALGAAAKPARPPGGTTSAPAASASKGTASAPSAARALGGAASVPSAARTEASPPKPSPAAESAASAQPASSAALSPEARRKALADIEARISACEACALRQHRTHAVPGQGNPNGPDVLFIGEAPGADEDQQGLAFVGAAGQFLTKMIQAMGYTRDDVFIANICKCRPPGNRTPLPEEMQTCLPYLRDQIRIIRPKVIVLLGGTAIKGLLNTQAGVTRIQGQWTQYDGIPVMPTFHPAYILRFESFGDMQGLKTAKTQVWSALKLVLAHLGRPVSPPPAKA